MRRFFLWSVIAAASAWTVSAAGAQLDSDNDGLSDAFEDSIGSNKLLWDSDGDRLSDGYEVGYDGDATTYAPYHPLISPEGGDLNVLERDTDGDTLSDRDELIFHLDPLDVSSVAPLPLLPIAAIMLGAGLAGASLLGPRLKSRKRSR